MAAIHPLTLGETCRKLQQYPHYCNSVKLYRTFYDISVSKFVNLNEMKHHYDTDPC